MRFLEVSKLLYYHACELYLKAYLRLHKWDVTQLRDLNDLSRMLDEAISAGLEVAPQTKADLRRAVAKNDYVKTRYLVSEDSKSAISVRSLSRVTADLRTSVGIACVP